MNKPSKRLLDQVREQIRLKHYSIRTEQAYVDWIKRFMPESCIKIDEESSILSILTRRQAGGFHMLRYLGFAIVLLWLHPKVPSL